MPLQKQLLDVPLSLGLDQKTDVRGLQPQQAVQMSNCVRLKTGNTRKRFGHTSLPKTLGSGTLGSVNYAGSFQGAAWMAASVASPNNIQGLYIGPFSDQMGGWGLETFANEAQHLDRRPLISDTNQILDYDISVSSAGVLVYVYQLVGSNRLNAGLLDMSGGGSANSQGLATHVGTPQDMLAPGGTGSAPKVLVCGTTALAFWQDTGTKSILVTTMSLTGVLFPTWNAPTTLATPSGSFVTGIYDVCAVAGDATRFVLAYETSAQSVQALVINVSNFTTNRTLNFDTQANFNTLKALTVCARNNGHYWVAYTATAGSGVSGVAGVTRAAFFNEGSVTQATPATVYSWPTGTPIGKAGIDATEALGALFVHSSGEAAGQAAMANATLKTVILTDSAGAVSVGSIATNVGLQLSSKPVVGSQTIAYGYFGVVTPSLLQGTMYALGAYKNASLANPFPRPVATFAPRLTKVIPQPVVSSVVLAHAAVVPTLPGSVIAFPISFSTQTFRNSLAVGLIDVASTRAGSSVELGQAEALTASAPYLYDGMGTYQPGFVSYPELPTPTAVGSGGSLSAGSYQYIAHYEIRTRGGELIRSATSPAVKVTTVNNDSVTFLVPQIPIDIRHQAFAGTTQPIAYLALYRTTANGTLFYRVTPDPPTASWNADNGNGPGGFNISITDTMSDATLTAPATAQLIYTTGGVLDNFLPAGARAIAQFVNRWMLSGGDDPTQCWPSKALTSGESPGFNEAINFNWTGACRALQAMDDKLIAFVQRGASYGIEYITGQGPTDLGTQSDWTPPQPIPSDVGAIDQRGTCVGPFGVLFRSPVGGPNGSGGIFLLSRDLQVQYLSKPVENTLNANPVVTSMVVHPNAGRVYVTCVPIDTGFTSGVRLVWDYLQGGIWSVDNMFDADTSQTSAGARTAYVANTASQGLAYHWVTSSGRVYRETNGVGANAYTDAGTWVTMTYQSAWLKRTLAGFARFWGVQLLADSLEAHDFTMTLTYDYAPSSYYNEAYTWTAPQIAAFDRTPQIQVHMTPGNQKAEVIQVTLNDAPPTGGGATTGQGPSWAALVLELGVKEGAYRNIPPAQRA
jgi:hypothetical protein